MNAKTLTENWIKQIEEFKESFQLAQRAYKRTCGGYMDSDEREEYANEQNGCEAAIRILKSIKIPKGISEQELRKLAVDKLNKDGPKNPQRGNVLSTGIICAIAVIEGNPESCYNYYHPRQT